MGIISIVCAWSWAGIICGIIGWVLGAKAKKELTVGYPNGMARAGVICSIIGVALFAVIILLAIVLVGAVSVYGI